MSENPYQPPNETKPKPQKEKHRLPFPFGLMIVSIFLLWLASVVVPAILMRTFDAIIGWVSALFR